MSSRAPIFAIVLSVVFFLPAAAQAESCVDHVTNSLGDDQEIVYTLQSSDGGNLLSIAHTVLQTLVAQAALAKRDMDNLDTIEFFIPLTNKNAHAALQAMRAAKQAQINDLMEKGGKLADFMQKQISLMCVHADADKAKEAADEADRAARTDNPPPDHTGEAPPGGWGDPPRHDDNDSDGDGDAAAALAGGLLLGGAIAGGGGHHDHHGGDNGGNAPGCHPHH